MNCHYPFYPAINLLVEKRISADDAARQERTAREILRRLTRQPGLVLADEVGMGKTFVALAAAVSVALADPQGRPVVIMVPPSLKEKWPKDFALFRERCLPADIAARVNYGVADRPVQFLKFLDDPPARRKQVLLVTHGAMSRALFDKWVKLALIRQAIAGKWGVDKMRRLLSRYMADILQMKSADWSNETVWRELLESSPKYWLRVLQRYGIDPDGNDSPDTADDPVPEAILDVLHRLDLSTLYEALQGIPRRSSPTLSTRLSVVRKQVQVCLQTVWQDGIKSLELQLPLLILDEAHHLKNRQTRLASLFHMDDAHDDAETLSRGALGGVFERMLFLTATPFQLGHEELLGVMERFDGIAWRSRCKPEMDREAYSQSLDRLRQSLDRAQLAALRLERAWGGLSREDLVVDGQVCADVDSWWQAIQQADDLTDNAGQLKKTYQETLSRMKEANDRLQPWVIRHMKPRKMQPDGETTDEVARRSRLPGRSINTGLAEPDTTGLPVEGPALLPFLLAARAVTSAPESRPVFAEGLASSYEAFLHTRKTDRDEVQAATDIDDDHADKVITTAAEAWYLDQLERVLLESGAVGMAGHPKVAATVARVADLWCQGEKVLVFCHYVATGRVLRQRISEEIGRRINKLGSEKLGCAEEDVEDRLQLVSRRFDGTDSALRRACNTMVGEMLSNHPNLKSDEEDIQRIIRRFMRTPSFLVRYFPLGTEEYTEESIIQAFQQRDASGMRLADIVRGFLDFLSERCSTEERERYLQALVKL